MNKNDVAKKWLSDPLFREKVESCVQILEDIKVSKTAKNFIAFRNAFKEMYIMALEKYKGEDIIGQKGGNISHRLRSWLGYKPSSSSSSADLHETPKVSRRQRIGMWIGTHIKKPILEYMKRMFVLGDLSKIHHFTNNFIFPRLLKFKPEKLILFLKNTIGRAHHQSSKTVIAIATTIEQSNGQRGGGGGGGAGGRGPTKMNKRKKSKKKKLIMGRSRKMKGGFFLESLAIFGGFAAIFTAFLYMYYKFAVRNKLESANDGSDEEFYPATFLHFVGNLVLMVWCTIKVTAAFVGLLIGIFIIFYYITYVFPLAGLFSTAIFAFIAPCFQIILNTWGYKKQYSPAKIPLPNYEMDCKKLFGGGITISFDEGLKEAKLSVSEDNKVTIAFIYDNNKLDDAMSYNVNNASVAIIKGDEYFSNKNENDSSLCATLYDRTKPFPIHIRFKSAKERNVFVNGLEMILAKDDAIANLQTVLNGEHQLQMQDGRKEKGLFTPNFEISADILIITVPVETKNEEYNFEWKDLEEITTEDNYISLTFTFTIQLFSVDEHAKHRAFDAFLKVQRAMKPYITKKEMMNMYTLNKLFTETAMQKLDDDRKKHSVKLSVNKDSLEISGDHNYDLSRLQNVVNGEELHETSFILNFTHGKITIYTDSRESNISIITQFDNLLSLRQNPPFILPKVGDGDELDDIAKEKSLF